MKILVPTDFSENALNALNFAKSIAKMNDNSSLTLVFAYFSAYDFAAQSAAIVQQIEETAQKIKEDLASGGNDKVKVDHKLVQGSVATAVTSLAFGEAFDLIIMGTQGESGISKQLMGSNTVHVIKDSETPVLIIPADSVFERVKEITVAVEWNGSDRKFFSILYNLTQHWNLPYKTLYIKEPQDDRSEENKNKLEIFLKQEYPNMTHKILIADETIEGIDNYLKERPDSLLVMFSKNKYFVEYLFDLSHTEKMAIHTHVPLLVLKD